jgi:hypothetical protein
MGDPLLAVAVVLSGFLFFSGCGSLCSRQWTRSPLQAIVVAGVGIALAAPLVLWLSHALLGIVATWNTTGRFLLVLTLLAPLAFLMGWPFPAGMLLLEKWSPGLLPWAWGSRPAHCNAGNVFGLPAGPGSGGYGILVGSGLSSESGME